MNLTLLGASAVVGGVLAYKDLTGLFSSLQKGPLLGLSPKNGYALQKVLLIALIAKRHWSLPIGFLVGHSAAHLIKRESSN